MVACNDTLLPEHETNLHCLQVEITQITLICRALNCNEGYTCSCHIKIFTQLIIMKTGLVVSLLLYSVKNIVYGLCSGEAVVSWISTCDHCDYSMQE